MRQLKVFLCHASQDKPTVRELYRRLIHDGVNVWMDEASLLPGMDWQLEIPKAVREADAIIVCLSKNSVTKEGYIQKEMRFALDVADEKPDGAIYLIPVRLEECDIPPRMTRWQWVDLFSSDGYRRLRISLRLRAEAVGAAVQASNKKVETALYSATRNSQNLESSAKGFNFGLVGKILAVLAVVIFAFTGIFWLGKGMFNMEEPQRLDTPTSTPTLPPVFTDLPVIVIITATPFSAPSAAPTSEVPTAVFTAIPTDVLVAPTVQPVVLSPSLPEVQMELIPAGDFLMGSNNGKQNEAPAHTVFIDAFYMDRYEVTNSKYSFCVNSGACQKPFLPTDGFTSYYEDAKYYPVVNVTWDMAKTYCEWRGARLPTEAEWEKAARGGQIGNLYPWGDTKPTCTKAEFNGAQFGECKKQSTADPSKMVFVGPIEIASFQENGYHLYDMFGNVWEWVSDWYAPNYYLQTAASLPNPQGPSPDIEKVFRGGSWLTVNAYLTSRAHDAPAKYYNDVGFRCAKSANP